MFLVIHQQSVTENYIVNDRETVTSEKCLLKEIIILLLTSTTKYNSFQDDTLKNEEWHDVRSSYIVCGFNFRTIILYYYIRKQANDS